MLLLLLPGKQKSACYYKHQKGIFLRLLAFLEATKAKTTFCCCCSHQENKEDGFLLRTQKRRLFTAAAAAIASK